MGKKAKLCLLKKKHIYQDVVDTVTLARWDRMKRLIVTKKMHWSPPMSDSSSFDSDDGSSPSSPYINSKQDFELESKLNVMEATNGKAKQPYEERPNEQEDKDLDL